jgi:hypothetical protein
MSCGVMQNPKPREVLKACSQKRAAPNINVMRFRCDEPKAKLRHVFFMRQEPAFSRRMRDGEGCRGCHGFAEKFPRICHASVKLERRLDEETAGALLCLHCPLRNRASTRFSSRPDTMVPCNEPQRAAAGKALRIDLERPLRWLSGFQGSHRSRLRWRLRRRPANYRSASVCRLGEASLAI